MISLFVHFLVLSVDTKTDTKSEGETQQGATALLCIDIYIYYLPLYIFKKEGHLLSKALISPYL